MSLRVFKSTVFVAIDEDTAKENEERDPDAPPVSVDELTDYLRKGFRIDWLDEEFGNPVGIQSIEVDFDFTELTAEEMAELKIPEPEMSITEIVTELLGGKWEEIDGPESGVGIDHWFQNEAGEEVYANDDQGFLTIEKDDETVWSGEKSELGKES